MPRKKKTMPKMKGKMTASYAKRYGKKGGMKMMKGKKYK